MDHQKTLKKEFFFETYSNNRKKVREKKTKKKVRKVSTKNPLCNNLNGMFEIRNEKK